MHLVRLTIAFLFVLPIGWNREKESRSAGLRTFPIIAIASCGLAILGTEILGEHAREQSRILQGLFTGIGMVGGGAILQSHASVHGTATAASVLNVGVIGMAVGFGYYDVGLVLSLCNFLVLTAIKPFKKEQQGVTSEPI